MERVADRNFLSDVSCLVRLKAGKSSQSVGNFVYLGTLRGYI